jgi:hypothetical protein
MGWWCVLFLLASSQPSVLKNALFVKKDLSLLCRLAIRLGYHPTMHAVVLLFGSGRYCALGFHYADFVSKWLL